MGCVKLSQLGFAAAASQDGDMIYGGVLHHRIEEVELIMTIGWICSKSTLA
jgi:hypothetical protein